MTSRSHIFGPVPSRRLGLSLGIDLIPAKTCTYDCLYCQVGRTTCRTIEAKAFVAVGDVIAELEQRLEKANPDTITLAGSGEPTLHAQIDQAIAAIKKITGTPIAILTNGALFWEEDVRRRVCDADIIMPTVTTAFAETFEVIHRPHPGLDLSRITDGLRSLRRVYQGLIHLEVVLLAGLNDSDREIEGLKRVIERISPEKIQLNTVVRPPADSRAIPLDRKRLEDIKNFFGEKTEIIAEAPPEHRGGEYDSLITAILEMAQRRPLRAVDMARALDLSLQEVEELAKSLIVKGFLGRQHHRGEVYYSSRVS